jgi:serine protease Do
MRTHPPFRLLARISPALLALALSIPCLPLAPMGQEGIAQEASPSQAPTLLSQAPENPRSFHLRDTPVVQVVRRVRGAVVNIHSERRRSHFGLGGVSHSSLPDQANSPADDPLSLEAAQGRVNGMGTGIIIDPRGYVLTNHHVIDEVLALRVTLDGGINCNARIIARDRINDLALLKIEAPGPLPVMPLGTARDLMVGETVIAIGNAFGYEHTVSVGVVSAVGRDVTLNQEISYKSLIQTDAAINPGNSGGPLINLEGNLVGINVAIRQGAQGICFAIPVDNVIRVAANLLAQVAADGQDGSAGVSAGLVLEDEVLLSGKATRRVTVKDAGGPAAQAGLSQGDVLVQVGKQRVSSSLAFHRLLLEQAPGKRLPVLYRHAGQQKHAVLVLQPSITRSGDPIWDRLGVRLEVADLKLVTQTHPQLNGGLWIAEIRAGSPAQRAGLQRGDILVGLHQWEMVSPDNVLYVLNHPDRVGPVRYFALRAGRVVRGWVQPN